MQGFLPKKARKDGPIPLRVVLVRPRDPKNIGACARALANFGLRDLVVVDPYEPIWRETRSAPGAEELVKKAKRAKSLAQALRGCARILGTSSFHQRPFAHEVVDSPNLAEYRARFPATTRWALVMGSERSGLSNAELAACHAVIRIPTTPETPSMNLAQATAVLLYEWTRVDKSVQTPRSIVPVSDAFVKAVHELSDLANYPPGYTAEAREGRIRQGLAGLSLGPDGERFLLSWARWLAKPWRRRGRR